MKGNERHRPLEIANVLKEKIIKKINEGLTETDEDRIKDAAQKIVTEIRHEMGLRPSDSSTNIDQSGFTKEMTVPRCLSFKAKKTPFELCVDIGCYPQSDCHATHFFVGQIVRHALRAATGAERPISAERYL